jgi:hypothetical protein
MAVIMSKMCQVYPKPCYGTKSLLVILLVLLMSASSQAVTLGRHLNFCFNVMKSALKLDFQASRDALKIRSLETKLDEQTLSHIDPIDLVEDRITIFDEEDIKTLFSLSSRSRGDIIKSIPNYFSKTQLLALNKAYWFRPPEDQTLDEIKAVRKTIDLQLKKYAEMTVGASFFDTIPAKWAGHWYVYKFFQNTLSEIDKAPFEFIDNFVKKASAGPELSPELDDATFNFLISVFKDRLTLAQSYYLANKLKTNRIATVKRNRLTIFPEQPTLQ